MTTSSPVGQRGYAICTTPRSGSNYLCQLLESTGLLGRPLEYFNGPARRVLNDPSYPDDPWQQIARIRTMGATANGVYGLKLFPSQHDQIQSALAWTEALPRMSFILLERRDLLGQALSWSRAIQSGQYRSTQQPSAEPVRYEPEWIYSCLRDLVRDNARWRLYFARNGLRYLGLVYEDVVAAPHEAVMQVAGYIDLGEPPSIDSAKIDLQLQRDQTTEEWRARFLSDRENRSFVDSIV